MRRIELVRLERDCSSYATFQSHNQRIVQSRRGIFVAHLLEYDAARSHSRWRLARSGDGGSTFSTVYESPVIRGNKPACLEADSEGGLLALSESPASDPGKLMFLRFPPSGEPASLPMPESWAGKFSMVLDPSTRTVFAWDHYGRMYVVDPDRGLRARRDVVRNSGPNAATMYPHVALDEHGLHHAWTTQAHGSRIRRSIHYIRSRDHGVTWTKADGTPHTLPIVPDDTGPADPLVLPEELDYETWLSSMLPKDGRVHFAYRASTSGMPASTPPMDRQHYVRIDLGKGRIDRRVQPLWRGDRISLNNQDGFFATRRSGPLVHVNRSDDARIAALISRDEGDTWEDLAMSDPVPGPIYSISGCREITDDGFVLGAFTLQKGDRGDPHFFKVPVTGP